LNIFLLCASCLLYVSHCILILLSRKLLIHHSWRSYFNPENACILSHKELHNIFFCILLAAVFVFLRAKAATAFSAS